MFAPLWEWAVDHGTDSTPTGVCRELHRAIEALSLSLAKAHGPASGHVAPVALVDEEYGFGYERRSPTLTADCEKGIITWK